MNTVDRSVASLDIALRRRFYIQRVAPMDGAALKSELSKLLSVKVAGLDDCIDAWADANKRLSVDLGENALLGHSYFFDALNVYLKAEARRPPDAGRFRLYLKTMFRYALLPQLVETLRALGVAGAVFTSGQDDQEDSEFSDLKKAVDKLAGLVGLGIHYNDRALDSYTIIDKK